MRQAKWQVEENETQVQAGVWTNWAQHLVTSLEEDWPLHQE